MSKLKPPFHDARIAVLDDDPDISIIIKLWLGKAGYHNVFLSQDQSRIMHDIEYEKLDLLLLDWEMPGLSGLEVLKQVRKHNLELPIIMLTNVQDRERVMQAISSGVTDFVIKTALKEALAEKVGKVLDKIKTKK